MHAYLVIGESSAEKQKAIENLKPKASQTNLFEVSKIEHVRELTRFITLGFNIPIVVQINDIDKASIEAQNAILKPLEEPQKNIIFILTARSAESVLPTIISRTQLVSFRNKSFIVNQNSFIDNSLGSQFAEISKLKTREKAIEFVTNLIYQIHSEFIDNPKKYGILEELQNTLTALEANGNISLQLTRLIISIN